MLNVCGRAFRGTGSALVLGLLVGGCGTSLVFSKSWEEAEPHPQSTSAGCPVANGAKNKEYIAKGDEGRDALLAARAPLDPIVADSLPIDVVAQRQRDAYQAFLDEQFNVLRVAQACYEEAAKDEGNSYAYLNLGVIQLAMSDFVFAPEAKNGYYTRAQNYFNRARDLNRFDAQTIYYQAELHVRRQQYPQAEKLLQELISKGWDRAHVHNLLGWIYSRTDRHDESLAEWKKATEIDTPAIANDWAIKKTRPHKEKQSENPDDDRPPDSYYRFNFTTKTIEPLATPPNVPCGWSVNGKPRC